MQYAIASGECIGELIIEVNRFISIGYKPIGGVSVTSNSWKNIWAQAMVKEKEE